MTNDFKEPFGYIHPKSTYILGLDLNRRGKDSTAFSILEQLPFNDPNIFLSYFEEHNYDVLTKAIDRVILLHAYFDFKKIYIDSTGLGSGVCDVLKQKISGGIVEEVMFTQKSKAEMFWNLKLLMQQNKLKLPNYLANSNALAKKLYFQLLAIRQEQDENDRLPKIYHDSKMHDDLVCSLALAALYFNQRKSFKKSYGLYGNNPTI